MGGKTSSKGQEGHYASYKANRRWEANRKRKLLRAQKANPNNPQIEQALKNIAYRRKTPNVREWSSSNRRTAILFKLFTGVASKNLFSTSVDLREAAVRRRKDRSSVKQPEGKVNFTLGARAHNKQGELVWG